MNAKQEARCCAELAARLARTEQDLKIARWERDAANCVEECQRRINREQAEMLNLAEKRLRDGDGKPFAASFLFWAAAATGIFTWCAGAWAMFQALAGGWL